MDEPKQTYLDDFEYDDHYDGAECWNCGGEGYVYSCVEEYACIDPEGGCDYCARRCDVCNPKPPVSP